MSRKLAAQRATSFSLTRRRMDRIRRLASWGVAVAARTMVSFMPAISCGLTRKAPASSSAAPVNSLSTRVPRSSYRQATYSLATRFIPSRSGVTNMTSAAR